MPGLLRGVARTAVIAGTATAVSNRVSRRQAGRWAQRGQQPGQAAAAPGTAAPPAEASAADRFAQLKELGDLRDSGVLTEDEFEVEKRRLLTT